MPSTSRFLISLLLLLLLRPCHSATIHCHDPQYQRLDVAPYDDCLVAIAHIPSHAPALAGDQLLSHSYPFHPQAGFLHGRCRLIAYLRYEYADDPPAAPALNVDPIPQNETALPFGFDVPNEANVFRSWTAIKELARRVAFECVHTSGVDGHGEETLDRARGWRVRLRVYVGAVPEEGVWAINGNHPLVAGRRALGHPEPPSFMRWNDVFAQTYNVV